MTQPNEQSVVNNKLIIVTLIAGKAEASITVGPVGNPSHPHHVSIQPFLDAGLTEREALKRVIQIAEISVAGATR
ncbi:conserved hypothetical protein [Burkholderia diffusa]|uniref:hypothetical protein n=1 Tax=Burkholderia diffusa TaxID=488732 RepID=UPI001CB44C3D|nr:hypothetical protein [Burkholderia diffusa]CAG9259483.1 conserved hypothetical protein [Burkholderia diffusa]